jgi:hypothetical protein
VLPLDWAKEMDAVNQYAPFMYRPTATGTASDRKREQPQNDAKESKGRNKFAEELTATSAQQAKSLKILQSRQRSILVLATILSLSVSGSGQFRQFWDQMVQGDTIWPPKPKIVGSSPAGCSK